MLTPLRGLGTYSSSVGEGRSFRVIHPFIHLSEEEEDRSHLCVGPLWDECPALLLEGVHVGIVVPPHLTHGLVEPPEQHQVVPPHHHPGHEYNVIKCSAVWCKAL